MYREPGQNCSRTIHVTTGARPLGEERLPGVGSISTESQIVRMDFPKQLQEGKTF